MTRKDIFGLARAIRDSGADARARLRIADSILASYEGNAAWGRHAEAFHAIATSGTGE